MSSPEQQPLTPEPETAAGISGPPTLPSESCPARCCFRGPEWAQYYLAVDEYIGGPCQTGLNMHWKSLNTGVAMIVHNLRVAGLARWDKLPPAARARMSGWSPAARQLWESDFEEHQNGLLQAWVWHYLEDNIFWSAGATGVLEELAPCAFPVWEHVRALRRELHAARIRHSNTPKNRPLDYMSSQNRLAHLQAWGRLTESVVMHGLGLHDPELEPFSPDQLIPHFKQSLRLLVVDGNAAIPDREDNTWVHWGFRPSGDDFHNDFHQSIKEMLRWAVRFRHFFHGMAAVWDLRFSPPDADKPCGFAFDEKWMTDYNPSGVPRERPGEEARPPVQLVIQPMLVKSGFDRNRKIEGFDVWERMRILSPWTFDMNDAYPDHPRRLAQKACNSPADNDDGNDEDSGGGGRAQGNAKDAEEAAEPGRGIKAKEQTAATAPEKAGDKRKARGGRGGAKHIRAK